MDELIKRIEEFETRFNSMIASLHLERKKEQLQKLQTIMTKPDFWNDTAKAKMVSQEAAGLESLIQFWETAAMRLRDLRQIALQDEKDTTLSLKDELEIEFDVLVKSVLAKEVEVWLNELHDARPAIVTIYSGAGGVDAQDWAAMLERMYIRFAEQMKWRVTVLQRTLGQEAGIKNVTLRIEGPFTYGYLRVESGVHRLVRLSPYDADQLRHTSFAMVEVLPELDEPTTIEVPKDDVRVDVFRSSGHGGQSVNTTDSAVRLTHIPTGITTSCQNERSQMQNKAQAWKMLMGKLEKYYAAQREEDRQLLRGEFTEAAWGNQIRSYVLHPYKMVKDHRTKYEVSNPDAVLEGALLPFIEAALRMQASEKHAE